MLTFDELMQIENEKCNQEEVLDMIAPSEPIAYGRDKGNDNR